MESNRKQWNEQHQLLQRALQHPQNHEQAIELFLKQHAMVHSAQMANSGLWSFEDDIWKGLNEAAARCIPVKMEHSIAWVIWHIARIEDVTMNLLIADGSQVMEQDNWLKRMNATIQHSGNAMDEESIVAFSTMLDLDALRAYRVAVGQRTREIVKALSAKQLRQKVEPSRLQRIRDERAILETAGEIIAYWGRRTAAGLLLMPATRHNFLHLNEAARIKSKSR